jgi:hypothetical protein
MKNKYFVLGVLFLIVALILYLNSGQSYVFVAGGYAYLNAAYVERLFLSLFSGMIGVNIILVGIIKNKKD